MKKIFLVLCLLMTYGTVFGQSHVVVKNGQSGTSYQVWVATAVFQIISADYAGAYSCYTLKSLAGTFWFDYDTTVSTWASAGLTYKVNGLTGESGKIVANEHKTINGILGSGLWVISNTLAGGCTIQVDINRLYQ